LGNGFSRCWTATHRGFVYGRHDTRRGLLWRGWHLGSLNCPAQGLVW
jgi:hypothetical protein